MERERESVPLPTEGGGRMGDGGGTGRGGSTTPYAAAMAGAREVPGRATRRPFTPTDRDRPSLTRRWEKVTVALGGFPVGPSTATGDRINDRRALRLPAYGDDVIIDVAGRLQAPHQRAAG